MKAFIFWLILRIFSVHAQQYTNLSSFNFRALKEDPKPNSTHEFNLWSTQNASWPAVRTVAVSVDFSACLDSLRCGSCVA